MPRSTHENFPFRCWGHVALGLVFGDDSSRSTGQAHPFLWQQTRKNPIDTRRCTGQEQTDVSFHRVYARTIPAKMPPQLAGWSAQRLLNTLSDAQTGYPASSASIIWTNLSHWNVSPSNFLLTKSNPNLTQTQIATFSQFYVILKCNPGKTNDKFITS